MRCLKGYGRKSVAVTCIERLEIPHRPLRATGGRWVPYELLPFFFEFPLFLALGTFLGLAAAVLCITARGAFPGCHWYPSFHTAR